MGLAEEQNATLRLLSHVTSSTRSIESARNNIGVGLDARHVPTRSTEEVRYLFPSLLHYNECHLFFILTGHKGSTRIY